MPNDIEKTSDILVDDLDKWPESFFSIGSLFFTCAVPASG